MLRIDLFTDPACPFAWSAEPHRRKLAWIFGDQVEVTPRMVVLSQSPEDYTGRGFTTDREAAGLAGVRARYGMPIATHERARMRATVHACRAVVAARRHAPEQAGALLRRLRVRHMAGGHIDEQPAIDAAAREAGIEPDTLAGWCGETGTETALREDMQAARDPLPAARALDHKLAASNGGGRRYTCPTFVLHRDGRAPVVVPGYQPWESLDVALANLEPHLVRRPAPDSVSEVLRWAREPLAAAEIALVCDVPLEDALAELGAAGTAAEAIGDDALWTFAPRFAREPQRVA